MTFATPDATVVAGGPASVTQERRGPRVVRWSSCHLVAGRRHVVAVGVVGLEQPVAECEESAPGDPEVAEVELFVERCGRAQVASADRGAAVVDDQDLPHV